MRAATNVGVVVAAYLGAVLIAFLVTAAYMAANNTPDRQASGGMSAFGDSLVFLAVFGVAAVVPHGMALFFLRPYPAFWPALSVFAFAVTATGLAALVSYVGRWEGQPGTLLHGLAGLDVERILVAPLCALAWFIAALMAPARAPRIGLFLATATEGVVFAVFVLVLVFLRA
jgi:hypothetical protein